MIHLNQLIKDFPQSIWLDDARTLRLELAALVNLIGEKRQKALVQAIVEQTDPEETQRKAVAGISDLPAELKLSVIRGLLEDVEPVIAVTALGQGEVSQAIIVEIEPCGVVVTMMGNIGVLHVPARDSEKVPGEYRAFKGDGARIG